MEPRRQFLKKGSLVLASIALPLCIDHNIFNTGVEGFVTITHLNTDSASDSLKSELNYKTLVDSLDSDSGRYLELFSKVKNEFYSSGKLLYSKKIESSKGFQVYHVWNSQRDFNDFLEIVNVNRLHRELHSHSISFEIQTV